MHRRSIPLITAAALAALAGQATAQQHRISPSEARQISQKLQESDKSLTDAIQLAERETGGKALAAHLMTSSDMRSMDPGQRMRRPGDPAERDPQRDQDRDRDMDRDRDRDRDMDRDQDRNRDMDRDQDRSRDMDRQPADRAGAGQAGLHASVTCLVNDSELHRVIINLEENRVVQSGPMGAGDDMRSGDLSAGGGSQMRLASDVINANVVNSQDDDLGQIDDLALDVSGARVRYAVLLAGGVLGMGGDRHAVPLDAMTFAGNDQVRINATKEQIEQRQGFDNDRWPQQPGAEWQNPSQRQQPEVQRPGRQGEMGSTVEKASDVIGATVHGAGDASVGDVEDIVIKTSDSSISHYVVATGDGKVAVPASKIRMSNRRLTLDMEQSEFEQLPKFRDNENPDWTNPQWLRDNERRERNPLDRDDRNPDRRGGG